MKLNKKECRKFANPGLKMAPGNGLLHAKQIDYIIRTAIKIIDRHKTLILYIYPRGQAAQGDFRPCWTMFHGRDDFIALFMKDDGSTVWRTAAFERLGDSWEFTKKCAFYSARDEARLCSYFKSSSGGGLAPLISAQAAILEKRRQQRQRVRENRIISRMAGIQALPRGLKGWIHKSVMPAYFFYDYKRGGRDVPGVCSSCGREIRLSGVKQGKKGTCPHCRREIIMKPRSRRKYLVDRDTCQVIENTGDGGLVIRIIKVYYTYTSDTPKIRIYENARQFVYQDTEGKICLENYYYDCGSGIRTDWRKGVRPTHVLYQYNFEGDTCAHIYNKNLPDALKGTPWQYCPIAEFYNHFRKRTQALLFLGAYLHHPRLEHLVKTRFYSIVLGLAFGYEYGYSPDCLDETQNRTHRILKVAAEDVPFLRDLDVTFDMLKTFQGYSGIKDRQKLLAWQMEHKISRDILQILNHMTVHKAMKYLNRQYEFLRFRKTPQGTLRYDDMQGLVTEYRDYLDICSKLKYDLKNSFVLYPKDLQKAHDKTAHRLKHKKDAKIKKGFIAVYQDIFGKLDFEQNGLKIVYPATPDDVIVEGHALHHCVGSYVDRVARGDCVILFLRQCSDVSQPYYTIEVQNQKAVQVRGLRNCGMTSEVQDFITSWEQRVLSRCTPDTAA